tara:strand:+ start:733 stop:1017 length:285 start_codon:yes stop_codon:yes gene_type:complete
MFIGALFNLTDKGEDKSSLGWGTIRIVDRVLISKDCPMGQGKFFYNYNLVCIVEEEEVPEVFTIRESEFEDELISGLYALDYRSLKALQARGWK